MREEYQDGHRYASSIYEEARYPRMTLDALPLNRQRAMIEETTTRKDRTMDERTLNNTEADEWMAQEMPAVCDDDIAAATLYIREGGETVEGLYNGLNEVFHRSYQDPMPVTLEQFERWLQKEGFIPWEEGQS